MVLSDLGRFTVVSRKLREHLWPRMIQQIEKDSKSGSISLRADAQTVALEKLETAVETHTAELDENTANIVSDVCRDVLLKARYPEKIRTGLDGVDYHAGHWIPGAFLSGTTWSPEPDSVAGLFVGMEEVLKTYAEAVPSKRDIVKSDLLARAAKLSAALKISP
jgi:hypothetical protein